MNILFDQCSWENPAYMQAMEEIRENIPMVSTSGRYIIDGVFNYEIPEERKGAFNRFNKMQFYLRNKFLY